MKIRIHEKLGEDVNITKDSGWRDLSELADLIQKKIDLGATHYSAFTADKDNNMTLDPEQDNQCWLEFSASRWETDEEKKQRLDRKMKQVARDHKMKMDRLELDVVNAEQDIRLAQKRLAEAKEGLKKMKGDD